MRMLQLHCNSIDYAPTKKEIEAAEEIVPEPQHLEEVLVAFVTIEKNGDADVAQKASDGIREHMGKIGCSRLLLYPYAHLSSDLASPGAALGTIRSMKKMLEGLEVSRAPFGWTKFYSVSVKGHPMAERSRVITGSTEGGTSHALKSESKIKSYWYTLSPDGSMRGISKFNFQRSKNPEILSKYETAKKRGVDAPPPHVALMKKLAIADYEPASDSGNIRFYPNGRLIKSLIERYVTERVREYGGYEVETPIMYDTHHPSMESYFNWFPARQYSVDSEGKDLFLRFAACFGQFLIASDLQMSYRNLPYRLYGLGALGVWHRACREDRREWHTRRHGRPKREHQKEDPRCGDGVDPIHTSGRTEGNWLGKPKRPRPRNRKNHHGFVGRPCGRHHGADGRDVHCRAEHAHASLKEATDNGLVRVVLPWHVASSCST